MKPILFNTEMVRAIQEARKTVTRRAVKPQPRGGICNPPIVWSCDDYVAAQREEGRDG